MFIAHSGWKAQFIVIFSLPATFLNAQLALENDFSSGVPFKILVCFYLLFDMHIALALNRILSILKPLISMAIIFNATKFPSVFSNLYVLGINLQLKNLLIISLDLAHQSKRMFTSLLSCNNFFVQLCAVFTIALSAIFAFDIPVVISNELTRAESARVLGMPLLVP